MRRHVTRLAERLVEAHHVDAAELHLMTVGGTSATAPRAPGAPFCVNGEREMVLGRRSRTSATVDAACGFTIMPEGLVNTIAAT